MFCRKCGKQIKDGILFCPYCGQKIAIAPSLPQMDVVPFKGQKEEPAVKGSSARQEIRKKSPGAKSLILTVIIGALLDRKSVV